MKRKIRILAWMLVMALTLGMIQWPTGLTVMASLGQVHVIVENTTFASADGAAWDGTLLDEWVELKEDSNALSVVKDALDAKGMTQTGIESGYVTEINGLAANDGAAMSGWMGMLNDWFTYEGLGTYTVADGSLSAGDEVRIVFSMNMGADVGNDFWGTDASLATVTFGTGTLNQDFDSAVTNYTLTVPAGTTALTVIPTAKNKYFQTRVYADGVEYRRNTQTQIPVDTGTVLKVTCGEKSENPSEPTPYQEYIFTVQKEKSNVTADVTIRSQLSGGYLHGLQTVTVASDLAESYGYKDNIQPEVGVSALDALVKTYEMVLGEAFTEDTAQDYLTVADSGWVMTNEVFGYSFGYYINQVSPSTLINDTKIQTGDVVDFLSYADTTGWSDQYTWINWLKEAGVGEEITVQVVGGYTYDSAIPVQGAKLGWVDSESGAITEIAGAVTDQNGKATFTLTEDPEQTLLTALPNADGAQYLFMNPSRKPKASNASLVMSAASPKAKLYRAGDAMQTEDLLEGMTQDGYAYDQFKLLQGTYILQAMAADGVTVNGTIQLEVTSDTDQFEIETMTVTAQNNGWKYGTDYTVENLNVTDANGNARVVTMGKSTSGEAAFLSVKGDSYTLQGVPAGSRENGYNAVTANGIANSSQTVTLTFSAKEVTGFDDAYQSTGNTLMSQDFTTTGSIGGEWKILGLARSGREIPDAYYQSAVSYIKSTMDANGRLSRTKSTENSRMILAMTALGYDASDINGMNLLQGLSDLSYVKKQGINGAIWALIALDSGKYEIPTSKTGNQVTREALVQEIVGAQMADGMWSLDGTNGDIDITAMALQALAPYTSDAAVQAAVNLALQTLSAKQNVNGDFGTRSDASAETCAQVVVALTSLGIDPNTDSRFVKAEGSVLNALLRYYENGMFSHVAGGGANQMATEQAYYAMVAYKRLMNGQTSLYDMSDAVKKQQPVIPNPTPNPEPSTPELKPEEGPHTGDDSAPMSWYLLLMAGSAVCGLCLYRRRRF